MYHFQKWLGFPIFCDFDTCHKEITIDSLFGSPCSIFGERQYELRLNGAEASTVSLPRAFSITKLISDSPDIGDQTDGKKRIDMSQSTKMEAHSHKRMKQSTNIHICTHEHTVCEKSWTDDGFQRNRMTVSWAHSASKFLLVIFTVKVLQARPGLMVRLSLSEGSMLTVHIELGLVALESSLKSMLSCSPAFPTQMFV